jgi:GxxExxY protein
MRELSLRGIRAAGQVSFSVMYKGRCVGDYVADLLVERVLVVELKCVERLGNEQMAQCLNYLRGALFIGEFPEESGGDPAGGAGALVSNSIR